MLSQLGPPRCKLTPETPAWKSQCAVKLCAVSTVPAFTSLTSAPGMTEWLTPWALPPPCLTSASPPPFGPSFTHLCNGSQPPASCGKSHTQGAPSTEPGTQPAVHISSADRWAQSHFPPCAQLRGAICMAGPHLAFLMSPPRSFQSEGVGGPTSR